MTDLGIIYGWNQIGDIRMPTRWEARHMGKNIYEYTLDETQYITMTGLDIDSYFAITPDYRLVSMELKQVTALGADSAALMSYSLHKQNPSTKQWGEKVSDAGNFCTAEVHAGVTWEFSACSMFLRLNATSGHLVYPVLTLQYIKGKFTEKARRQ